MTKPAPDVASEPRSGEKLTPEQRELVGWALDRKEEVKRRYGEGVLAKLLEIFEGGKDGD